KDACCSRLYMHNGSIVGAKFHNRLYRGLPLAMHLRPELEARQCTACGASFGCTKPNRNRRLKRSVDLEMLATELRRAKSGVILEAILYKGELQRGDIAHLSNLPEPLKTCQERSSISGQFFRGR